MRTIVVEQDAALGQVLARSLRTDGNEADWVGSGEAALARALAVEVDLMVLDLQLPVLTGIELLQQMQERFSTCSLIVLMSEDLLETRVRCLDLGADDCVMKPFSLQELTARCRAQLRRRSRLSGATIEHGGLMLRRKNRTVLRDGIGIELTAKEFALLEYLVERRGRCSSRAELLRQVFQLPETSPTNVVEVYINYLRRKLSAGDLSGSPAVIETVRGSGYRIVDPQAAEINRVASQRLLQVVSL